MGNLSTHWQDYQNEESPPRANIIGGGSAHGTDDERDNVVLFDAHGEPVVVARYREQIGYRRTSG